MPVTVRGYWDPDPIAEVEGFALAASKLENFAEPLALAGTLIAADVRSHFAEQADPGHTPWEPWSQEYAPRAERENLGGILEKTLALRDAVGSPESYNVTGHEVFLDTSVLPFYWEWHQTGLPDRQHPREAAAVASIREFGGEAEMMGNPLPARPYIGLSTEAIAEIEATLDRFVETAMSPLTSFRRTSRGNVQTRVGGRFGPLL